MNTGMLPGSGIGTVKGVFKIHFTEFQLSLQRIPSFNEFIEMNNGQRAWVQINVPLKDCKELLELWLDESTDTYFFISI